jgi:hypothetical protein
MTRQAKLTVHQWRRWPCLRPVAASCRRPIRPLPPSRHVGPYMPSPHQSPPHAVADRSRAGRSMEAIIFRCYKSRAAAATVKRTSTAAAGLGMQVQCRSRDRLCRARLRRRMWRCPPARPALNTQGQESGARRGSCGCSEAVAELRPGQGPHRGQCLFGNAGSRRVYQRRDRPRTARHCQNFKRPMAAARKYRSVSEIRR